MGKISSPDHKFWSPALHAGKVIILKTHIRKKAIAVFGFVFSLVMVF